MHGEHSLVYSLMVIQVCASMSRTWWQLGTKQPASDPMSLYPLTGPFHGLHEALPFQRQRRRSKRGTGSAGPSAPPHWPRCYRRWRQSGLARGDQRTDPRVMGRNEVRAWMRVLELMELGGRFVAEQRCRGEVSRTMVKVNY